MMFHRQIQTVTRSSLLDQGSFYQTFISDMRQAQREIIIESPFMTSKRLDTLIPTLRNAINRGVSVTIDTKPPEERRARVQKVKSSMDNQANVQSIRQFYMTKAVRDSTMLVFPWRRT